MVKIGFLVNPIAGMGGRVGLKGTDGKADEALRLGAKPISQEHADIMLAALRGILDKAPAEIEWLTCSGPMGAESLERAGFAFRTVFKAGKKTASKDTLAATKIFMDEKADLILFCGGDGTARDICSAVKRNVPMLGIPSGVKMHSGVFGITPAKTAEVLAGFISGELKPAEAEIMDLDEDLYRKGEWAVRLFDSALTPFESTLVQTSKMMVTEASDADILAEISEYIGELVHDEPETLFILGPGGTTEAIGKALGIEKTLLGIDAWAGGKQAGKDLNEQGLLKLFDKYNKVKLILSPIGSQGFILGRGNLQLSPQIIRRIGRDNIIVISTPAKLAATPVLRFDTGDAVLDTELAGRGWFSVVMGYRLSRLAKIEI
ncbi:MAG: ATP-NAD kinase family protein [Thermoplasmata archaeon]|nr:ATP-NAD kinase family protein [Thermoplasmata archaeon]